MKIKTTSHNKGSAFPAVFDLSSLNGRNGFAINGIHGGSQDTGDRSG